jgi:uncharacterized protein YprB with RNaseH-like and TPR domain
MKRELTIEERIKRQASHHAQRLTDGDLRIMRTAGWDIEATNLDADMGIMLCSSIKPLGEKAITHRIDESPGYREKPWDDKWLAKKVRDELENYMVLLGWNHVGYDLPFLNTRLLAHGCKPLDVAGICMVDLLWASRYRLRLHSNRLDSVIQYLATKTQKTPLLGSLWIRAMAGDKKALDKVVEHNIHDVDALEEVSNRLSKFVKLQYRLIK